MRLGQQADPARPCRTYTNQKHILIWYKYTGIHATTRNKSVAEICSKLHKC